MGVKIYEIPMRKWREITDSRATTPEALEKFAAYGRFRLCSYAFPVVRVEPCGAQFIRVKGVCGRVGRMRAFMGRMIRFRRMK
jgi:hypothetical protein